MKFSDFGWTIKIPADYLPMPEEEAAAAGTEILFRYQKDAAHYIEAYSEYFDENADGSYARAALDAKKDAVDMANQMMPESTTLAQSEAEIDGLPFLEFATKLTADAQFTLYTTTFTRLFKKQALTIAVYYSDAGEGKRLTGAVLRSVFRK